MAPPLDALSPGRLPTASGTARRLLGAAGAGRSQRGRPLRSSRGGRRSRTLRWWAMRRCRAHADIGPSRTFRVVHEAMFPPRRGSAGCPFGPGVPTPTGPFRTLSSGSDARPSTSTRTGSPPLDDAHIGRPRSVSARRGDPRPVFVDRRRRRDARERVANPRAPCVERHHRRTCDQRAADRLQHLEAPPAADRCEQVVVTTSTSGLFPSPACLHEHFT